MECKQLDYFLTVCKEKSFSKAANKLFISQQGLSKSISNLESELEVPLFIRSNTGVELTPFGEALETYANILLNQHDYIVTRIRQKKKLSDETLYLGFATGMFELLPSNFLTDFMKNHPSHKIKIMSFTDDMCAQSILDYKINIGFCPGTIDSEFFKILYSKKNKIQLIAADSHPLASKEEVYMKDLKNEIIVTLNTRTGPLDKLMEKCKDNGFQPSIYISAAEVRLMEELCSSGLAVSFYTGRKDTLPDNIKIIDIKDLNIFWEFHLVVNKGTYLTDLAKEFIDYTIEKLQV